MKSIIKNFKYFNYNVRLEKMRVIKMSEDDFMDDLDLEDEDE